MEADMECCDVCGGPHETQFCPELGLADMDCSVITLSRARLTLPSSLAILEKSDNTVGIIAKDTIPAKSKFGPFEARRTTHELYTENCFLLKVFSKDGSAVSLDTTDENECNWMCLIQTASSAEEQNCMAVQIATDIYYSTTKEISAGQEMAVWYAPHYAKKLGKTMQPDGTTKVMLGLSFPVADSSMINEVVEEIEEPVNSLIGTNFTAYGKKTFNYETTSGSSKTYRKQPSPDTKPSYQFFCEACSVNFSNKFLLDQHMFMHNEPPQEESARLLDTSLKQATGINPKRHSTRILQHSVDRTGPVKCTRCNKVYDDNQSLAIHIKLEHLVGGSRSKGRRGRPPKNSTKDAFNAKKKEKTTPENNSTREKVLLEESSDSSSVPSFKEAMLQTSNMTGTKDQNSSNEIQTVETINVVQLLNDIVQSGETNNENGVNVQEIVFTTEAGQNNSVRVDSLMPSSEDNQDQITDSVPATVETVFLNTDTIVEESVLHITEQNIDLNTETTLVSHIQNDARQFNGLITGGDGNLVNEYRPADENVGLAHQDNVEQDESDPCSVPQGNDSAIPQPSEDITCDVIPVESHGVVNEETETVQTVPDVYSENISECNNALNETTTEVDPQPCDIGSTSDNAVMEGITSDIVTEGITSENGVVESMTSYNVVTEGIASDNIVTESITSDNGLTEGITSDNGVTEVTTSENVTESIISDNDVMEGMTSENIKSENIVTEGISGNNVVTEGNKPDSESTSNKDKKTDQGEERLDSNQSSQSESKDINVDPMTDVPVKRKRGRPRRNPLPGQPLNSGGNKISQVSQLKGIERLKRKVGRPRRYDDDIEDTPMSSPIKGYATSSQSSTPSTKSLPAMKLQSPLSIVPSTGKRKRGRPRKYVPTVVNDNSDDSDNEDDIEEETSAKKDDKSNKIAFNFTLSPQKIMNSPTPMRPQRERRSTFNKSEWVIPKFCRVKTEIDKEKEYQKEDGKILQRFNDRSVHDEETIDDERNNGEGTENTDKTGAKWPTKKKKVPTATLR